MRDIGACLAETAADLEYSRIQIIQWQAGTISTMWYIYWSSELVSTSVEYVSIMQFLIH